VDRVILPKESYTILEITLPDNASFETRQDLMERNRHDPNQLSLYNFFGTLILLWWLVVSGQVPLIA